MVALSVFFLRSPESGSTRKDDSHSRRKPTMPQDILQSAPEAALEEELALRRAPAKATKPFIFYEEPVWIVRRI